MGRRRETARAIVQQSKGKLEVKGVRKHATEMEGSHDRTGKGGAVNLRSTHERRGVRNQAAHSSMKQISPPRPVKYQKFKKRGG